MQSPEQELLQNVLRALRENHAHVCRHWFQDIELMEEADGVIHLRVHQDIHKHYLERECGEAFDDAARDATGRLMSVRFLGPNDPTPSRTINTQIQTNNGQATLEPKPTKSNGLNNTSVDHRVHVGHTPRSAFVPSRAESLAHVEGLPVNPDYTFENFVIGHENRLAHAAAEAVAEKPGRAYNPLFIHGGVGLGKTHLLQAICLTFMQNLEGFRIRYGSCEDFSSEYTEAVRRNSLSEFRLRYRDLDCIIIDDVHFLTRLEKTQEEFFHTFNALYQAGKQIVVSSDAPPQEIPDLESRLVSRFQSGLVAEMKPTLYETRMEIVRQKVKLRALDMPDEVVSYVAGRITSNVRELEGAIISIQMQSQADKRSITLDLAKLALGDDVGDTRPELTISHIIDAVTEHYDVKITDLQSKRRHKSITGPRQVCMYLARKHTRYSLEEIGGYFGGRDHTTVMHAVKTVQTRLELDPHFEQVIAVLERRVGVVAAVTD
ncbi:MAG: chromosomal replication initiator protein DnaA [Planctomycetota bacterium]